MGWEGVPGRPLLGRGDHPRPAQRVPRFIPADELARVMEAIAELGCPFQKAALLATRWSGARRSEIQRLALDCLDRYPDGTARLAPARGQDLPRARSPPARGRRGGHPGRRRRANRGISALSWTISPARQCATSSWGTANCSPRTTCSMLRCSKPARPQAGGWRRTRNRHRSPVPAHVGHSARRARRQAPHHHAGLGHENPGICFRMSCRTCRVALAVNAAIGRFGKAARRRLSWR